MICETNGICCGGRNCVYVPVVVVEAGPFVKLVGYQEIWFLVLCVALRRILVVRASRHQIARSQPWREMNAGLAQRDLCGAGPRSGSAIFGLPEIYYLAT
jgi:hypothetical protein